MAASALKIDIGKHCRSHPCAESSLADLRDADTTAASSTHALPEDDVIDLAIATALGEVGAASAASASKSVPGSSGVQAEPDGPVDADPRETVADITDILKACFTNLQTVSEEFEFFGAGAARDKKVSLCMFSHPKTKDPTVCFMKWMTESGERKAQQVFLDPARLTLKFSIAAVHPYWKLDELKHFKMLHSDIRSEVSKARDMRDPIEPRFVVLKKVLEAWLDNTGPNKISPSPCIVCKSFSNSSNGMHDPLSTCCLCLRAVHTTCLRSVLSKVKVSSVIKAIVPPGTKLKLPEEFKRPHVRCQVCASMCKALVS